jgi:hypothetical protein
MYRLTPFLILAAAACAAVTEPTTEQREAPDVPWPAVEIDGPLKSPASLAELLDACFIEADYDGPPAFHYEDEVADGDDWQPAELCVEWAAHIDVADCVRRGLLDRGGVVSF